MKRTLFYKKLAGFVNDRDCDGGIAGLCKSAGIPYQTMQTRLRQPRGMRMYEFDGIASCLHLTGEEQLDLLTAIRND